MCSTLSCTDVSTGAQRDTLGSQAAVWVGVTLRSTKMRFCSMWLCGLTALWLKRYQSGLIRASQWLWPVCPCWNKELVVAPFACFNCLMKDVHSPVHGVCESGKSLLILQAVLLLRSSNQKESLASLCQTVKCNPCQAPESGWEKGFRHSNRV